MARISQKPPARGNTHRSNGRKPRLNARRRSPHGVKQFPEMKMRKSIAIAIAAAFCAAPFAHAQTTAPLPAQTGVLAQNVSDLWWDPTQSGWGVGLFQTGNFVFATLF